MFEAPAASGDCGDRTLALCAAIVEQGISIDVSDDLGGADDVSLGGRIKSLRGLSHAEAFVVLVHEYAHELLHRAADRPT